HYHMEVSYHKIGIGQWYIDNYVAEEQACQTAVNKGKNKSYGKQHRRIQTQVALPQGEYPVIDFQRCWNCNHKCCSSEEETEVRIHSADVHVVRPYHKAQATDCDNRPHHHAITKNIFAGMGGYDVGHQTKSRQCHDVNLRMAEEPE